MTALRPWHVDLAVPYIFRGEVRSGLRRWSGLVMCFVSGLVANDRQYLVHEICDARIIRTGQHGGEGDMISLSNIFSAY